MIRSQDNCLFDNHHYNLRAMGRGLISLLKLLVFFRLRKKTFLFSDFVYEGDMYTNTNLN